MPAITGERTSEGLKIFLPAKMDTGPYYFQLTDKPETVIPGSIDVEPDKIKLTSVFPATAYRGQTNKFDFDIAGENFSRNPENDDVTIEGQGSLVKHRGKNKEDCANQDACLWVESDRLMHIVGYRPGAHQGVINVGIMVGNVPSAERKQLVLARFSGTFVFILGAVITGLLFWLVSYVVSGVAHRKVGRKRLTLLQSFILDPETNSYSLSKFQLLAFSSTFIFAYLYVLLSRWLVQWQFSLPDVPNTIAGLLGISAGTTVASAGLTAARGAKGAGFQQPSGADLISSGGVVVPERFQFFVWTIVACGGFLALLTGQDPAKVNDFPELPSGLLYLMGVSAVGYLGGKAARKPGPILELITVEPAADDQTPPALIVQGQNLGSDGRFFVDDKELGIVSDADKKLFTKAPPKLMEPKSQIGAADTNFCNGLRIFVLNSNIDLKKGDHLFRIVNRDGQFADLSFSVNPPTIQAVYEQEYAPGDPKSTLKQLPESTTDIITAVVKGSGLRTGSQATWRGPGDQSFTPLHSSPADPPDEAMLIVTLVPGKIGTATLNITTPSGFVTCADVDVVPLKTARRKTTSTTAATQSQSVVQSVVEQGKAAAAKAQTELSEEGAETKANPTSETTPPTASPAPAGVEGHGPPGGAAAAPTKPEPQAP